MSKNVFRFSAMGTDVDLDDMIPKKQNKERVVKTEPDTLKKTQVKNKPKPTKKKLEHESLQALAFGHAGKGKKKGIITTNGNGPPIAPGNNTNNINTNNTNNSTNTNNKKNAKTNGVHNGVVCHKEKIISDDWKNRDRQFVEEENERGLREALLLSKLDYEANKNVQPKKEDSNTTSTKTKKKKKEKPITVSLSDFNTMDTKKLTAISRNGVHSPKGGGGGRVSEPKGSDNFFTDVDKAVKSTMQKESRQKQYSTEGKEKKTGTAKAAGSKGNSCQGAPRLVAITEVEKRDFEIQALRLEVLSVKDQLDKVKLRNKKLCEVLGTAEMRTMGELVIELDKVCRARDEFSAEVASLSEQLEQEKTKVSLLQDKHRKK